MPVVASTTQPPQRNWTTSASRSPPWASSSASSRMRLLKGQWRLLKGQWHPLRSLSLFPTPAQSRAARSQCSPGLPRAQAPERSRGPRRPPPLAA